MTTPEPFAGLLLVDKPVGMTSHDVVLRVRRRLRSAGAGHLGTLDPGASGLLVIALGAATRAIPVWQAGEKTYEGRVLFGVTTATQDLQGEVVQRRSPEGLDVSAVKSASERLVGEIDQIPPMVSAVKVGGERLHRIARRGLAVERSARRVKVALWEWLDFALPEAGFRIRCSRGTYVRTLVHDLGQALGTGAALKSLRRTRSEPFGLDRSVTLDQVVSRPAADVLERAGVPLDEALGVLPAVSLDEVGSLEVGRGGRPRVQVGVAPLRSGPRSVALRGPDGRALALGELEPCGEPGRAIACPHVVFPWAVRAGRRAQGPEGWNPVSGDRDE